MSAFSARICHRIKDTAILQFAKKASAPYFILFPWFDNQPNFGAISRARTKLALETKTSVKLYAGNKNKYSYNYV